MLYVATPLALVVTTSAAVQRFGVSKNCSRRSCRFAPLGPSVAVRTVEVAHVVTLRELVRLIVGVAPWLLVKARTPTGPRIPASPAAVMRTMGTSGVDAVGMILTPLTLTTQRFVKSARWKTTMIWVAETVRSARRLPHATDGSSARLT